MSQDKIMDALIQLPAPTQEIADKRKAILDAVSVERREVKERIASLEVQVAKLTEEREDLRTQVDIYESELDWKRLYREAYARAERAEARVRELQEALLKAVDCVSKFKSYYITDNQLGLNPTANAEVREANATLKRFKALLASAEPEKPRV